MLADFLINLVVTILGLFVVLLIDRQRRPKLELSIGDTNTIPLGDPQGRPPATWLRVRIRNKGAPLWLRWVYSGDAATVCQAWISFLGPEANPLCDGKDMYGRWTSLPDPPVVIPTALGDKLAFRVLPTKDTVDIPPGDSELLDIAFRAHDEESCWGWCTESYYLDWRHPRWQLPKGVIRAKVRVRTGGCEFSKEFLLRNDLPYASFRLESVAGSAS